MTRDVVFEEVIDKCVGCNRIDPMHNVCLTYPKPVNMWRVQTCVLASHIVREKRKEDKVRVGQQKQKKKK